MGGRCGDKAGAGGPRRGQEGPGGPRRPLLPAPRPRRPGGPSPALCPVPPERCRRGEQTLGAGLQPRGFRGGESGSMGSMREGSPAPHGRKGFSSARRRRRLPRPGGPEGAAGAGSLRFCLPAGSRCDGSPIPRHSRGRSRCPGAARPRGPGGTNPGLGPAPPQGDPARSETGLSPRERASGPPKTGPA